jgi:hypothetical protein
MGATFGAAINGVVSGNFSAFFFSLAYCGSSSIGVPQMRWNIQANRGCTKCYFQTEKLPVKDELSCSKKKRAQC